MSEDAYMDQILNHVPYTEVRRKIIKRVVDSFNTYGHVNVEISFKFSVMELRFNRIPKDLCHMYMRPLGIAKGLSEDFIVSTIDSIY